MLTVNPFMELSAVVSPLAMQIFVVIMVLLTIGGTVLDMIHKKNVKYFFENAQKVKKAAAFFTFCAFSKKYLTFFL